MMCAIGYLIIPIVLFFFGWLKIYLAIPFLLIIGWFGYRFACEYMRKDDEPRFELTGRLFGKSTIVYWAVVTVVSGLWTYLSGIGGYVFQNDDFLGRNPMYRDLSQRSWPFIIDLSQASDVVQRICGSSKVGFIYYFTWWLPSSFISKITNASDGLSSFLLWFWAFIGVVLVMYLLTRAIGKCHWLVPLMLVIFSGMDIIPYYNINKVFPILEHIEWWPAFFQYSSNTTLLFWVFNQAIPVWIIMGVLLAQKDNKFLAAISALAFAYSPWATIALVVYAVVGSLKKDKSILKAFNFANISVPLVMLLVFGLFYRSVNPGPDDYTGFTFNAYSYLVEAFIDNYVRLVVWEFGVYLILLWKDSTKEKYYWITVIELILIPIIMIRNYNFFLRGSIPALFMLMYYIIQFFVNNKGKAVNVHVRKGILVLAIAIGCVTPFTEIARCVVHTAKKDTLLVKDQVYSFAQMQIDDETVIGMYRDQFFSYNYEEKPFFKYLAR